MNKFTFFWLSLFISFTVVADTNTHISTGYGADTKQSLQNAVASALQSALGAYVTAETQIEKRTEIENTTRNVTKSINTQIREYSNGAIESIEVLAVANNGGLVKTTAKIVIRDEQLLSQYKSVIETKSTVSKGLFAKIAAKKSNDDDLRGILEDQLIRPLAEGSNMEHRIVAIENLDDRKVDLAYSVLSKKFPNDLLKRPDINLRSGFPVLWNVDVYQGYDVATQLSRSVDYAANKAKKARGPKSSTVVITVKSKVDENFISTTRDLLEDVSKNKVTVYNRKYTVDFKIRGVKDTERVFCLQVRPDKADCYVVETGALTNSHNDGKHSLLDVFSDRNNCGRLDHYYQFKLALVGENKDIFEEYPVQYSENGCKYSSYGYGREGALSPIYQFKSRPIQWLEGQLVFWIIPEIWEEIHLTIPDSILSSVHSVTLTATTEARK